MVPSRIPWYQAYNLLGMNNSATCETVRVGFQYEPSFFTSRLFPPCRRRASGDCHFVRLVI